MRRDSSLRNRFSSGSRNRHGSSKRELKMLKLVRRFARDESGATAIEYGLVAAGISVAIIVMVQAIVR
jgi:pilus assembly protein Flp/PilA